MMVDRWRKDPELQFGEHNNFGHDIMGRVTAHKPWRERVSLLLAQSYSFISQIWGFCILIIHIEIYFYNNNLPFVSYY